MVLEAVIEGFEKFLALGSTLLSCSLARGRLPLFHLKLHILCPKARCPVALRVHLLASAVSVDEPVV